MSETDTQDPPQDIETPPPEENHPEENHPEENPPEEEPEDPKQKKEEEKKQKRRETNKRYYEKVKAKAVSKAPPERRQNLHSPPPAPKPKAKKPPKAPPPPRKLEREPRYEPSSPRTTLVQAYREARLAQLESKREKYSSWFN